MSISLSSMMRTVGFIALNALLSSALLAQWTNTLPLDVQQSILWEGDHEEGTTFDWTMDNFLYPGGGIFNTGDAFVENPIVSDIVHSGNYSIKTRITEVCQVENKHAVRLMRWTDTAWDDGGEEFPDVSYYSTWVYFPETYNANKYAPWDVNNDGGWWNIFQFKSNDENDVSEPMWTVSNIHDDENGEMYIHLWSKWNDPSGYFQSEYVPIPVGEWFHLEARYERSDTRTPNGAITIWQNGVKVLEATNVVTFLEQQVTWGIGNYTDHVDGPEGCGNATIYFDDAVVATQPLHPYLNAEPVTLRARLQGAFDGSSLMDDALRSGSLLPQQDPFGFGLAHGFETIADRGPDSVVDWVRVSLRDVTDRSRRIYDLPALIQRDGDIVGLDGLSLLQVAGPTAPSYFITLEHRNHLAVGSR